MFSEHNVGGKSGKIMLVGCDNKQILERRFQAAGTHVVKVTDNEAAFDHARHEAFDATVLVSRGSLINVAETVFNLRDLNRSMESSFLSIDWASKPTAFSGNYSNIRSKALRY
jgi:hypothetical protein